MFITYLELSARDLQAQKDFYCDVLGLSVSMSANRLEVKAGKTDLIFTEAESGFDGAYHFAFNIPENQFRASKEWVSSRLPLLRDENGMDEFDFSNWNAHSFYFKDAAGNILEFIARHNLKNNADGDFDSKQILQVSEIGLPSQDVLGFASDLCARLALSVFMGQPSETFTPVGDDNGLFILPMQDRIWYPNTGIPAKLLPVKVKGRANGKEWEVRGVPYEIYSAGAEK